MSSSPTRQRAVRASRVNRSWQVCRSVCRCSTFILPAPAADRLRVSMPAACCASGRSQRARSRGRSVLVAGDLPTVTDANLVLGRLDPESFLGGGVQLDRERTERIMHEAKGPLESVEKFAAGILRVVETHMERAIRVVSVERGHDPRDFALVAFGGGGPLHACSLARALRIPTVLVPAMPGALSAVGILLADAVRDYSRTVMLAGDAIGSVDATLCGFGTARRCGVCGGGFAGGRAAQSRHPLSRART